MKQLCPLVPALLAAILQRSTVAASDIRARDPVSLAAPIVAPPSQFWDGNDGRWSSFEIRIGTPPTTLRVLPSTSWQETWAVADVASVCNTTAGVSPNCTMARGGVYNSFTSSTWKANGAYELGLNNLLGYDGYGQYGLDTVGIGWNNATGVALGSQVVAEITSDQYWLGILGIGFQPTNLTGYQDPLPSFTDTLYANGNISSMSWSYTAGAYYRLKTVFGSLIFGGYDALRFQRNNVTFDMTQDNLRDIVVTIRSITSTTSKGSTALMSTPEFAFIDSSVAEFWLPVVVCQAFEKAFGLQMDNATGLYLLNASTHSNLLSLNPNVTFTLANEKTGGDTVDIVLPYASFDLNVSAPIYNGTSYWFPLRQGQSDAYYTLGRTFLQEAYVTTHYNSRTFNVSQALFPDGSGTQIVAIPSILPTVSSTSSSSSTPASSSSTGSTSGSSGASSTGLSGGAIAGIVVGAVVGLLLIGILIFCLVRRRRSGSRQEVHEIDSGKRLEPNESAYSAQASALASEVPGQDAKHEIAGNPIMHPQELEAEVPMLATQRPLDERVNGVSDSTRGTKESSQGTTEISSLSQSPQEGTRELASHGAGMGRQSGPIPTFEDSDSDMDLADIVSPASPTGSTGHMFGRTPARLESEVGSPAETNATWSPETPVGRGGRFGR